MDLKQRIIDKALDIGLDIIGVARARTLAQVRAHLAKRTAENRRTGLEWNNIEERVAPELLLEGAQSIISAGIAYYQPEPKAGEGPRGRLSRSAWGQDYHLVLGSKLRQLASFIVKETGARVKTFVDTGPPVDRAWAIEAGLGWSGKNCALITPGFGSWVFLGSIYTDLALQPDTPVEHTCGECELCLKACPTGALGEAHVIDPYLCVSYLSQMKGFIPRKYRRLMGTQIYGCDTCQAVCPANRQAVTGTALEFTPNPEAVFPLLSDLLQMNNRQFKQRFGGSAAGWRGRSVLQRNAIIALGNLRSKQCKHILIQCLSDPRPIIRGHAAWALAEMGEGAREMRCALEREHEPEVKQELALALNKIAGRQGME